MGQFLDRFESTWMAHPHDPESEEADVDFHVAVSEKSAAVLREALAFYDQFAAQNAANARLLLDTADAHRRVGEIHERLGEYGQAEKAYHRAIEIYDRQSRRSAQAPDLALLTASTLNQLGRVERILGRFENARTYFSRAGQVLAEEADDSRSFRYELARTHGNLGSVLWHLQEPAEAVRSDRRAIELLERLVDEEPGQAEYRLALARAYRRHHPVGPENPGGRNRQWFRAKAVSIIEDLVKKFPRVPDYRCELSETLAMMSFEPRPFGDFGGPPPRRGTRESQLRRAMSLAKALTDEYPEIPRYRAASARSQKDLAWLLHTTGRPYAAEPLLSAAVTLYEDLREEYPTVEAYQFFLAMALQSHGNVLRDVDRLTESRRAIQRAIEQQESYLKARPNTAFGKSMLARQNDSLAKTLKLLGEEDEAAEASRQAKEIRKSIKRFGKREDRQP
jgi:tetratricopeptide (TPR) repeat protein